MNMSMSIYMSINMSIRMRESTTGNTNFQKAKLKRTVFSNIFVSVKF